MYITGNLDEALRIQEESRRVSPFPNPFGLVNLAAFYYVRGDEAVAERCLGEALAVPLPTEDACVKVCETLARFKRHEEILRVADKSAFADASGVCFFTGIAAANMGDRQRAKRDLERVTCGHHKSGMVQRYLQCLREGTAPRTASGDWPYLVNYEVCPLTVIEAEQARDEASWFSRRIVVDITEVFLNEAPDKLVEGVRMLSLARHPDATVLLWTLAKGTFGPDGVRMEALRALQERGAVDPKETVEIYLNGKRSSVSLTLTKLNPDFRFGKVLPKAVEKIYEKAVKAGFKKRPDWEAVGKLHLQVLDAEPEFYPARYNYAISLVYRNRTEEAACMLRDLVAKHPDYLFARATLLQLLIGDRKTKEADELCKSMELPGETHPDAMVAWHVAQVLYHEAAERYEEAYACAKAAIETDAENEIAQRIWSDYEEWDA